MFCRKNKKYYFAKKWECHGTPGTPGVDGPGIITFVSVILKKTKFFVIPIYLHCCKIPKVYSSNSSNIIDYVNIVGITSTQHYTRTA